MLQSHILGQFGTILPRRHAPKSKLREERDGSIAPIFLRERNMKNFNLRKLTFCGILAAVYTVLTITPPLNAIAYGPVQFRVSEALCILPFFAPWTTWGLTLGCLLANLFSTVTALDVVIGTLATLIGCLITAKVRCKWLAPLPTVLSNGVIIGAMLASVLAEMNWLQGFVVYGAQVAFGELVVLYVLGMPLLLVMQKRKLSDKLQAL